MFSFKYYDALANISFGVFDLARDYCNHHLFCKLRDILNYLAPYWSNVFIISQIPETPQWLLSKNQTAEAEKSLRWLRGWVSSETVAQEFHELQQHSEHSKSCYLCIKQDMKCTHPLPTLGEKFGELKRKQSIKPLIITISLFVIAQFSGIYSMRPFMIQIFKGKTVI